MQNNKMRKEAYDLLKELLEHPSVNGEDNERLIAAYLAVYFRAHGIEPSVQRIDEKHANLQVFIPGRDHSRTVVWNGHMDTVPCGRTEEWNSVPLTATRRNGKVYARGASDMKSGLAAMVYVLTHLEETPACDIQFLATCDEERSGIGAFAAARDGLLADNASCMLIGEPTGMHPGTVQKGCLWLQLVVRGRTSHGAYPQEGVSAIHSGMRIADGLCEYVASFQSELLGPSTAQVTMIRGGVAPNMTADECTITMDIRMVPGLTAEMVLAQQEKLFEEIRSSGVSLQEEVHILNQRRAIETAEDDPMVVHLTGLTGARGYDTAPIGVNFFTDASALDREGRRRILLFGPGDPAQAHKPNEYVELEYYYDAIEVLQEFARTFNGV